MPPKAEKTTSTKTGAPALMHQYRVSFTEPQQRPKDIHAAYYQLDGELLNFKDSNHHLTYTVRAERIHDIQRVPTTPTGWFDNDELYALRRSVATHLNNLGDGEPTAQGRYLGDLLDKLDHATGLEAVSQKPTSTWVMNTPANFTTAATTSVSNLAATTTPLTVYTNLGAE